MPWEFVPAIAPCVHMAAGDYCNQCEKGFFGVNCEPCPGMGPRSNVNRANICSQLGVCDDGRLGSGVCTCSPGFSGKACDVGTCPQGSYLGLKESTVPSTYWLSTKSLRAKRRRGDATPTPSEVYRCVVSPAGDKTPKPGTRERKGTLGYVFACQPGSYCAAGSVNATVCVAGTFSPNPTIPCAACPAGKYQPGDGKAACIDCVPGTFCPRQSTNFQECKPGEYSPKPDVPCAECKAGFFQSSKASAQCDQCAVGTYCEVGATVEKECQAGEYSADPKKDCAACAAGTYQSKRKQKECVKCAVGTYCGVGATKELECKPGTYSADPKKECVDCELGRHQPKQAQKECLTCSAGQNFQNATGEHNRVHNRPIINSTACFGLV